MWEEGGDGGVGWFASGAGVEDAGVGVGELEDRLAAGSAGHGGGAVEVGDGDGADADPGAAKADRGADGGLLGAGGEAVGGVLHVAAGDFGTVGEEEGGPDAESAIGGVGVCRGLSGEGAKVVDLCPCETALMLGGRRRHKGEGSCCGVW